MTGQHIERLRKAVAPMNDEDVRESRRAWREGATSLGDVKEALVKARPGIQRGFGPGSDITETALKAIDGMIAKIETRKTDMDGAVEALRTVREAMDAARGVATSQEGASDPGDPPRFPSNVGSDEADEIQAIKQHAAQTRAYNTRVAAFNADDAAAQKALQDLNDAYDEVIPVFAKIHGEPIDEPTGNRPGPGPGGIPGGVRPPTYTPPPGVIGHPDTDIDHPDIDIDDPDTDGPDTDGPDIDGPDIDGPDIDGPDIDGPDIDGPDIDHPDTGQPDVGGPGGLNPGLVGGGLLAGGLAAPGAINAVRGLLSRGGLSSGAQAIGSSTRAGGPGALGRGGAAAPGSPVARGAGGRGAGGGRGAAGARGVPGAQGGRGGRGGRGAVGAAGARGGRRKDGEREGADRDLYDDGQDWLDDEGTGPGVLG